MTPDEAVKRVFGHDGFRPGQRAAIEALLAGRDVQVLLPTGGGKSLCFQVPAVVMAAQGKGPMLVVSPLIALMEDQVSALKAAGVDARMLHSGIPWEAQKKTLAEASGAALLYCSPERVGVKRFRTWLDKVGISAVAVDEAHCISEWGHDFRKDYRKLDVLKSTFDVPIIALTATATRRVLDEISDALLLEKPLRVSGAFERENLRFTVEHHTGDKARVARCAEILAELGVGKKPGAGRAVVYASTRKKVVAVAKALKAHKLKVGWYHAGRTAGARAKAQSDFESGKHLILVATTAFGMGIDHPDVRLVCHVQAPGSLEAYYQQAGRAGRDGEPAECALLYGPGDSVTQARLRGKSASPGAEAGWKGLQDYVFGQGCREQALVHWFLGECGAPCGRCDACVRPDAVGQAVTGARQQLKDRAAARTKKSSVESAVVLDAEQCEQIIRFVDGLKKPLGRGLVALGLRGSQAKKVKRMKLSENKVFGIFKGLPEVAIYRAIDDLLEEGMLARKGVKYPTLWIPEKRVRPKATGTPKRPVATGLEGQLKAFRKKEARRRRWKAYQVFPDATLKEMMSVKPQTLGELGDIKGMGPKRLSRFGTALLELIAAS